MMLVAQATGNTSPKEFTLKPEGSLQIFAKSALQRLHSGLG